MSQATPRRALIVIDVQNEYDAGGGLPIEYPPFAQSLQRIAAAMDAAQAAGVPVIVVQHDAPADSPVFATGSRGWQLHEVVASRPHQHLIHKTRPSSFVGTDLQDWLRAQHIDTLTVCGYMTQHCNASTAVQSSHLGLQVEFLADASGSPSYENAAGRASAEEVHRVYTVVLNTGFAAVLDTADWIAALREGRAVAGDNIVASSQRARRSQGASAR